MQRSILKWGVIATLLALGLTSCSPARHSDARFPIIGNDPGGLVETMQWGDSPAKPFPAGDLDTVAVLESSTPDLVRIAVQGEECPPSAQVSVLGDPDQVSVIMVLGAAIAADATQCGDSPATHTLEIHFKTSIDLEGLQVTASRTGGEN